MYILLAILIFGFLIFVHELGHFLSAKLLGVQVNEFAICMGPAIVQKTVGETTYSLRCLPIGGYCAMEGEDVKSENPRAFTSAKWWKRLIILCAGAFMNLLTGFLITLCVFLPSQQFATAQIESVYEGSCLDELGILPGDIMYAIDGERIYSYPDVGLLLSRVEDGHCDLKIRRHGQILSFPNAVMEQRELMGEKLYGMRFASQDATLPAIIRHSFYSCVDFARLVRLGLQDLITGKVGLEDLGGPVSIVDTISQTGNAASSTAEGLADVFYLAAFIAINLAVMNMLPLPALDGGRVFFLLVTVFIEKISRKKLNPKYEGYIHAAGMVILLAFMVLVTFRDVGRLLFGG